MGACVVCVCVRVCARACVCVGAWGVSASMVHLCLYVCVYVRVLVPV